MIRNTYFYTLFIIFLSLYHKTHSSTSNKSNSNYLQLGENCSPKSAIKKSEEIAKNEENDEKELKIGEIKECDNSVPLECINGRCQCKRGYTISRNGTKCLEIARNALDSPCEESIQCWKGLLGRLSECNLNTGKCQCYESETIQIFFHHGRCYYGEALGEYCQIEGLCSATTPNAFCKNGVCQCKEGYIPSWDKSKCLEIAKHGLNSSCEENVQCEKSPLGTLSECNQELMKCQCYQIPMLSTVFHLGRCYFGGSLGDVCQVSAQCSAQVPNSFCDSDGKCKCDENEGYFTNFNQSSCLKSLSGDDAAESECLEDIQCRRVLGSNSFCNQNTRKCECFSEHGNETKSMIIVGTKCFPTLNLGENCIYNQQCSTTTPYAICQNRTCACEENEFIVSNDGKKCLKISSEGLGAFCEEDNQCKKSILGDLSHCSYETKSCSCLQNNSISLFEKMCILKKELDEFCEMDAECKKGPNFLAECIDSRCHCGRETEFDKEIGICAPIVNELKSSGNNLISVQNILVLFYIILIFRCFLNIV